MFRSDHAFQSETLTCCCVVQVAKSVEYVQQGTTALVDAKRMHKNTRKWLCIALIVVAIIVAIVIVVAIQPWKK